MKRLEVWEMANMAFFTAEIAVEINPPFGVKKKAESYLSIYLSICVFDIYAFEDGPKPACF